MTETVDRLGVDVEVTGFQSFQEHMKRVNELLEEFARMAPTLEGAGEKVSKALGKVKRSLGGAGMADDIKKESATTQAAINKMAVASVEATTQVTAAFQSQIDKTKELEKEITKLQGQIQKIKSPDTAAMVANLKAVTQATQREIQGVMLRAEGRVSILGNVPEAEAALIRLREQLATYGDTLTTYGNKRSVVDAKMIADAKAIGAEAVRIGAMYQKEFDAIARAQAKVKSDTRNLAGEMDTAFRKVERSLENMQRGIRSRVSTSQLDPQAKGEVWRSLALQMETLQKKADEIRSRSMLSAGSVTEMQALATEIANVNKQMSDSISIQGRQVTSIGSHSEALSNLRNRLENMRTAQEASIKAANLDSQQQASMIAGVDAQYRRLEVTLADLESRRGIAVSRNDAQAADDLARSITRVNTQISALVSQTAKANRMGLDDRFAKDTRVIGDYLSAVELARQRSTRGLSFMASDNQNILGQINQATANERQRYQEILAKSTELGAGESIKALRRLREDAVRETTRLNEEMERLSIQGAANRRALVTEKISPQDFATGMIQRAAESGNEWISKLAKGFFYLEESVSKSNTRWAAFFNVLERGKAIIASYLSPLNKVREFLGKPINNVVSTSASAAAKSIGEVGNSAQRASTSTSGLITKLGIAAASLAIIGGGLAYGGFFKGMPPMGISADMMTTGGVLAGAVAAGVVTSRAVNKRPEKQSADDMGKAAKNADAFGSKLEAAKAPATDLASRVKSILNQIYGADNAAARFGTTLGNSIRSAFTMAAGFNLSMIMMRAMSSIQGTVGRAFTAIGDEQAIKTQFSASISDSLVRAGEYKTLADAEEEAAIQAEELFDWTEKLAIISPFGQDNIAQMTKLLQVGGMTGDTMKRLNEILVDGATGLGLTGDGAESAARAISDIMVKGKLAGQEVLQLVNAGIPIMRWISEASGKTQLELTDFFNAGGIVEANDAVMLIAKNLEQRFQGQAEKAALTARGLANSIEDLQKKALRTFATPIFDQVVGPAMKQMVDLLQNDEVIERIGTMGKTVADALQTVFEWGAYGFGILQAAMDEISPGVKEIAKNFALFLASDAAFAALVAIAGPALLAIGALISGLISWYGAYTLAAATMYTAFQHNWYGIRDIVVGVYNIIAGVFKGLFSFATESKEATTETASIWRRALGSIVGFMRDRASEMIVLWGQFRTAFVRFGTGIIEALADGIAGGVNMVVESLNVIASAITYLLTPGSPPPLLPDLTDWGRGAADAYLEGWTMADFDILSSLTDSIEGALSAVGEELDPGELQKISQAVAMAVTSMSGTGSVDMSAMLDSLRSSVGSFDRVGEAVERMAEAQLKASYAQRQLLAAQEELEDVTSSYEESLKGVNDEIAELDRLLSSVDMSDQEAQLSSVINNRFATEKQKMVASLKLQRNAAEQRQQSLEDEKDSATSAIQARVDLLQEEYDRVEEIAEIAQSRYDTEIDQLSALTEWQEKARQKQEELNKAILAYRMQLADTPGKLALLNQELAGTPENTPEHYALLGQISSLQENLAQEQERLQKAILSYNMQLADTPGKIALMEKELAKVKEGSIEYYEILTQIASLKGKDEKGGRLDISGALGDFSLEAQAAIDSAKEAMDGLADKVGVLGERLTEAKDKFLEVKGTVLGYFAPGTRVHSALTGIWGILMKIISPLDRVFLRLKSIGPLFQIGQLDMGPAPEWLGNIEKLAYNLGVLFTRLGEVRVAAEEFKKKFDVAFESGEGGPIQRFFAAISETDIVGVFRGLGSRIIDEIMRVFGPGEEGGFDSTWLGDRISENFNLIRNLDFAGLWENIKGAWNGFWENAIHGDDNEAQTGFQSDLQWMIDNVQLSFEGIGKRIRDGVSALMNGKEGDQEGGLVVRIQSALDMALGEWSFDVTGIGNRIQTALEEHPWTVIGIAAAIVTALAAASWGVLPVVGAIISALASAAWSVGAIAASIATGIAGAMSASLLAAAAIALAGALAIALVGSNWESISVVGQGIIDEIGKAIVTGDFSGLGGNIMDVIKGAFSFDSFKNEKGEFDLMGIWGGTQGAVSDMARGASEFINGLIDQMSDLFSNFDFTKGGFSIGFFIVNFVAAVFRLLAQIEWGKLLGVLFSATGELVLGIIAGLTAGFLSIDWTAVLADTLIGLTTTIVDFFDSIFSAITSKMPTWMKRQLGIIEDPTSGDVTIRPVFDPGSAQFEVDQGIEDLFKNAKQGLLPPPKFSVDTEEAKSAIQEGIDAYQLQFVKGFDALSPEDQATIVSMLATLDPQQTTAFYEVGQNAKIFTVDGLVAPAPLQQARVRKVFTDLLAGGLEGADIAMMQPAADTAIGDIVDLLKNSAEIHSPSELSKREVGKPIGAGIPLGIQEALDEADIPLVFSKVFTEIKETTTLLMGETVTLLSEGLLQYVDDTKISLGDFYKWTEDETEDVKIEVVTKFGEMRSQSVTHVRTMVSMATVEINKLEPAFRAAAKKAVDAAVAEFGAAGATIQAALLGLTGTAATSLNAGFAAAGAALGKAMSDAIVNSFVGDTGNAFILALAAALQAAVEDAVARVVSSVAPAPAQTTQASSKSLATIAGRADALLALTDGAGGIGGSSGSGILGGRASMALSPVPGATVIYNTSYNIYQTVTPEQAVRVDRNFQLFEAKNRR